MCILLILHRSSGCVVWTGMGENYNKSKKENPEVKQCPQEKVEYIKHALRHFNMI